LTVFFGHAATPVDQADAGFGVQFSWDVDLLAGYEHSFLRNVATQPGVAHFQDCDTPEVGRILRTGRFDAVLLLGWHLKTFVQALVGAKRGGLPVLVRGDSQLVGPRSLARKLAKELTYPPFLRLFDTALAVGQRSREYWLHYHYPPKRIFLSPHAVDNAWFRDRVSGSERENARARLGLAQDEVVALFAGKLVERKRPRDLIKAAALAKVRGRSITVLIAGSGPLEQQLRDDAQASGVRLVMLGFCNQSQMPGAYAACDFLVLPSDGSETWGLVANEALACGRPVILSDATGSAPDLAGDGAAGRTFPMGAVSELEWAIAQIVINPCSPESIKAKADEHSIEAAAAGILDAAEFAVSARRRPRRGQSTARDPVSSHKSSPGA
jgi:glycosyltransferase involved in cell wall biosynthesis